MSIKFTSVPPKSLYQSILSTDNSFKLPNILGWDGNALTSADFGTQAFGAFLSADRTTLELFEWDPATIASSSITILYRGLKFDGTQTTEVVGNKRDWDSGSTTVMLGSDIPQLISLLVPLSYLDTDITLAADSDSKIATQKATKAYIDNIAIAGAPDSSTTTKGIGKVSTAPASATEPIFVGDNDTRVPTQAENDALVGTSGNAVSSSNKLVDDDDTEGTGLIQRASKIVNKFGGNGADGALTLTSGATNIDCANAAVVIKNYTSISITGTGQLTFTNPHTNGTLIILKSQGGVTLTSSAAPNIEVSGMGGAGGASGPGNRGATGGSGTPGGAGNDAALVTDDLNHYGGGGAPGTPGGGGAGGSSGPIYTNKYTYSFANAARLNRKSLIISPGPGGAGGGGGDKGTNDASTLTGGGHGGVGGNGGGALVIECAGALNFTSTIYAKGNDGTVGGTAVTFGGGGGGGAGGAAGQVLILYTTLTSASGTISTNGGAAGAGGSGAGANASNGGGGGGGAGSYTAAGGAGGAGGATNTVGSAGSAAAGAGAGGGGGGGGGAGAAQAGGAAGSAGASGGYSLVTTNNYFS